MFRTIYAALYIVALTVGTYPRLLKMKKLPKDMPGIEKDKLVHQTPHSFGRGMIKATGSTVTVEGLENIPQDRAVLFVANHQSNFDIPLLMGYLEKPFGFISKVEVKKLPIVREWMVEMNSIFMDRSDRRQSLKAIKDGIESLKNGHSLLIFPEGTRSKGDAMEEFKTGSFHLAVKSGVPIVPVTISGTHRMYESNGNRVKPVQVKLIISEPLFMEDMTDLDIKDVAKLAEERVASKL
jgi:1-acyl-sn-glycerol-3-phosphate acyltransferase